MYRTRCHRESFQALGKLYERFLSNILSLVSVVHESHDQTKDLVLILQHQQIEGTLVTVLHSLDQLLIIFLD